MKEIYIAQSPTVENLHFLVFECSETGSACIGQRQEIEVLKV
jgi:hypothetical protein